MIVPWVLLFLALSFGFWLRRRYELELAAHDRARETLATTELTLRRMRQSIESTSDAIGIGDMAGNSLYHNRAHLEMFGYAVEQLNAVPGEGVLFADKAVAREILASIRAGRSWRGETEVVTRDGRHLPVFVRADIIRDEDGKAVGIYGVFADVSERKQTERQLEEERRRLQVTLQFIGDGVITTDIASRIVLMNPVAERLTGWSQTEAAGRLLEQVMPLQQEETREPIAHPALRMLKAGTGNPFGSAYLLKSLDGTERIIAENAAFIRGADGRMAGVVQVLRDITEERQRSVEATRAGKLESLGLLAGGIAHDFGNLLTAMVGNVTMAQHTPGLPEAATTRLAEVERIIWRARDLTTQLTTFAKGGAPRKKTTPLPGLVREAAGFAVQGAPVQLACDFAADLAAVEADEGQLVQVVNNIVLNAVQAMPSGGRVEISARNLRPGDDMLTATGERWVEVTVADNGPGISQEKLPKIFDPFYTTKPKGTGLGLAMAYSIMKRHGGFLRVESTPGAGTTFRLLLPASKHSAAVAEKNVTPRRILLMDDERSVRDAIALMLTLLGYEVTPVRDGEEALEAYRAAATGGRPFVAVLLDLRVPEGMGGAETVRRLRELDPALCAVAASGYCEDPVMSDHRGFGFNAAIAKPFRMDELGSLLITLLEKRAA